MTSTKVKFAIGIVVTISTAAIMYFGAQRILEQQRLRQEITRLRDGIYRSRVAADRCRRSVASGEGELQAFDARIGEMRARVDSFEALDPRGVPGSEYDSYMKHFDAHNDSVSVWEGREQRLRTQDAACREVIVKHNSLGDSLKTILDGLGA